MSLPLEVLQEIVEQSGWIFQKVEHGLLFHAQLPEISHQMCWIYNEEQDLMTIECHVGTNPPRKFTQREVKGFIDSLWSIGSRMFFFFKEEQQDFVVCLSVEQVEELGADGIYDVLVEVVSEASAAHPLFQHFLDEGWVSDQLIKLAFFPYDEPVKGWYWGEA